MASSQLHVTKPGPVHLHMQRESQNERHVTPPRFIFMSQQSVSEVSSPLATQAPPPSFCSTTYESHLCLDPKSPSLHTPCRVYMLRRLAASDDRGNKEDTGQENALLQQLVQE